MRALLSAVSTVTMILLIGFVASQTITGVLSVTLDHITRSY